MGRYAIRAGAGSANDQRRRSSMGGGDARSNADAAALATVDAGLLPSSLNKDEIRRFATVKSLYLEARSLILSLWASDPTTELTSDACVAAAAAAAAAADASSSSLSPEKEQATREAFRYLSLLGAVNFGVIGSSSSASEREKKKEKEKAAAAAAAAATAGEAKGEEEDGENPSPSSSSALPPDAALLSALAAELASADLSTTTEKKLRRKLEEKFGGVDLGSKKQMLRAAVERFLNGEAIDVPGGDGGGGGGEEKEKEKEKEEAAAANGKAKEEKSPSLSSLLASAPLCRPGASAVVVGAGPAGIGAALHLSRCGVKVTVLEARARAGGRAHSVPARRKEEEEEETRKKDGGGGDGNDDDGGDGDGNNNDDDDSFRRLASAIDLGASIVTGVAPDFAGDASLSANATSGRRRDPSALLARQLRVPLHRLGPNLPLFDGAGGGKNGNGSGKDAADGGSRLVPKEADERADAMRDALLDDAKDAAFLSSRGGGGGEGGEGGGGEESGGGGDEEKNKKKKRSLGEVLESSLAARLTEAAKQKEKKKRENEAGGEGGAGGAGRGDDDNGGEKNENDDGDTRERAAFSTATPLELRLLDWHWSNLEYGCAAPLSRVCLEHWNQDDAFGGFGGGHAMVVGGFGRLLERAAASLASASSSASSASSSNVDLRLSARVKSIRWGGDDSSPVSVSFVPGGKGQEEEEVVVADCAIVTVPLGVLKASVLSSSSSPPPSPPSPASISFEPPLPQWKVDAVRSLGFGKLEKVFLEFSERFWPSDADYFGVLQPTTTNRKEKANGNGDVGDGNEETATTATTAATPSNSPLLLLCRDPARAELLRGRAFMFWDVGRFQPGSPPVLAALFSGAAAERFFDENDDGGENDDDGNNDNKKKKKKRSYEERAADAALASLRSAFGDDVVSRARPRRESGGDSSSSSSSSFSFAVVATRWGLDPFAGNGAYSFVPPGADGGCYDALARPCSRRLLFAGEHTAREHPDTVGGAMLSGVREASRALLWGLLGNAGVDGEEATRERRRRQRSSSSGDGDDDEKMVSSDDDDDESSSSSESESSDSDSESDVDKRLDAAEAKLAGKKKRRKKTRVESDDDRKKEKKKDKKKDKKKKTRRERTPRPRREAAARGGGGRGGDDDFDDRDRPHDFARTAEQAEHDARAAAAERADARELWRALAAAAAPYSSDPRARAVAEALNAAGAAPHRRAVALRCLKTADAAALAAVARNPSIVRTLASWTEEAAKFSSSSSSSSSSAAATATAIAADGARVLGGLPLPAAERGPSGAERAVRAVASLSSSSSSAATSAKEAAAAVLDSWFGRGANGASVVAAKTTTTTAAAAATAAAAKSKSTPEKKEEEKKPIISDDALPEALRARLAEAERAAAEAAEHAAAQALVAPAPVVADIGDFDSYFSARAKEEAKRRGLKRRKDAAAAALAAAAAEEEEEEAREAARAAGEEPPPLKKPAATTTTTTPMTEKEVEQEITSAVRSCVSAAIKRRLKLGKERLSKDDVNQVARKAAAKVVEAELRKHRERSSSSSAAAAEPPLPVGKFHLSESKQAKIAKVVEGYVKGAAAAAAAAAAGGGR